MGPPKKRKNLVSNDGGFAFIAISISISVFQLQTLLVDQYGLQANPSEMVSLRSDDINGLLATVAQTDAIYLGVIAAACDRLKDGSMVELPLKPRLQATARFAYVTLAGRTEAPAMVYFRQFLRAHLNE